MGTREMIQFAAEPIRRGGRVNDSPNQTAMVVRMELRDERHRTRRDRESRG